MVKAVDTGAARRLHGEGVRFVDVLPPETYRQEHIVGSVNVPLAELTVAPVDLDPAAPVVVYCFDLQ